MDNVYLRDAAIDIINAAKSSKDSDTKVFQLRQIKEILLHREKDLLPVFIGDVFNFMAERNASIRKFLLGLSSELFSQDPTTVLPKILELYQFFLSDSNDAVLSVMVREAGKLYSKIVLHIASIPESSDQDVSMLWATFRALMVKFQDFLVSARSDYLKLNCVRLIEEQILFVIPSTSSTVDPRLARRDPRLARASQKDVAASGSNNTAEAISLHHSLVSRNALQREAEDSINKLSTWILKGGPGNYPLSPNLQAEIAQMLASVGAVRPGLGLQLAKVVTQFITERSTVISQVDSSNIENMARAAMRLLRVSSVYASDPEGQMLKLKAAVNSLNITTTTENEAILIGKKRDFSEIGMAEENDSAADSKAVTHAVNAAVAARKEQQQRVAATAQTLFQSKASTEELEIIFGENTELSSDILSIETSAFRFNTVLISAGQKVSSMGEELMCYAAPPSNGQEYQALYILSLLKLLEDYVPTFLSGEFAMHQYKAVITRTILSMVIASIENEVYTNVKIIATWSKKLSNSEVEGIPVVAIVPRVMWLFVSFALQTSPLIEMEKDVSLKVEFLTKLCNDMADCCEQNWDNKEGCAALTAIYESSILAIMCRMLQIPLFRDHCKTFLISLHSTPLNCVRLLKLLAFTGTTGSNSYRGTKGEAFSLLAYLVAFSEDIDVATECLSYLLWTTLNEDFQLRSLAIEAIVNDIMKQNDWCNHRIFCFAIQSIAHAVGLTSASLRLPTPMDFDREDENVITLHNALNMDQSNEGDSFHGRFESFFHQNISEDFAKSAFFFNRLCLEHNHLLSIYMELYSAVMTDETATTNRDILFGLIKSSLRDNLPAIQIALSKFVDPAHEIFHLMSRVEDPATRPLMTYVLALLHTEFSLPAKINLIEDVYRYVEGTPVEPGSVPPIDCIANDCDFKLFLPLISGLNASMIERCLPRIIRIYGEDTDGLEIVFNRIVKARPPPMKKADLLIALHRINIEQHDVKTKMLTQAIAICLNKPSDFTAQVIRDTLQALLDDEVPPVVLMRTALLSANSFVEIKKFVLEKLIPTLIQRSVWTTAPIIWQGVMVGADNLTSGNVGKGMVDPTLKALMGIPGSVLKSVLKMTKNLKRVLAKYLQSLQAAERDDIVCGRSPTETSAGLEPLQDNDKKKIVKDLLSFNPDISVGVTAK